jgi:hypothetical protein
VVFSNILKWCELSDPWIGEQDVDYARFLSNDIVEAVEIREVGHITPDADRITANLAHSRIKLSLAAPHDEQSRAFPGEPLRACKPDAAVCSGDDAALPSSLPITFPLNAQTGR